MNYELTENKIKLLFVGELNSSNAGQVEEDVNATLNKNSFKEIILDFAKLAYISSAGLRTILKLKQKYGDVSITNACLEVYDVLDMTGFTNILSVSKQIKEIDVSNATIVGEGYFSTVYRIDKDTIIKVFNRTSDENQIKRELDQAKEAFILGIPTAISFDIVKVKDKLGVRFEMLDCKSLKDVMFEDRKHFDEYLDEYSSLLNKINSTECFQKSLPRTKELYFDKLELVKPLIKEETYQKLKRMLEGIDDRNTFVHGDCHFKNILVQNKELLLIDMDTLSLGNPIFEYVALRATYVGFEEDCPGNNEIFLGVSKDFAYSIYQGLLERKFANLTVETSEKIKLLMHLHMVWWTLMNQKDNVEKINRNLGLLEELTNKYDDLKVDC